MEVESWSTNLHTGISITGGRYRASSVEGRDMKLKLKFANYMAKTLQMGCYF